MGEVVLCVAEKPSIASALAKFLGHPAHGERAGRKQRLPVHEVSGKFQGHDVLFRVTSVTGHVYSVDFPPEYQNWKTTDPGSLFAAPIVKKATETKVCKHLQKESHGCDAVILWLDCDREGENICFEVLDNVLPHLRKKKVFRAKFSALTESDVRRAMQNLVDPDINQSRAVDARQELDLKIGVAWTRFQTGFFDAKYGDLDSRLISYGPCQTPTLGFVVGRHDEIQSFAPEPFWYVAGAADVGGAIIPLEWSRKRVFAQSVGNVFLDMCSKAKGVLCVGVKRKPCKKQRPTALNTVELLRVCSRQLGIGPAQAMHIAEDLYIRGYISYPRTESTAYPKSFSFTDVLRPHVSHEDWGSYVKELLVEGLHDPRPGSDAGDHPPITPMRVAHESDLGFLAYRVYEHVARTFIATVSPDCAYDKIKVEWAIGDEKFSSSTVELKRSGYTRVLPFEEVRTTILSVSPQEKTVYPLRDLRLGQGETSPPDYLTEADLISLMEQNGIGTDASIPVHINNICERNFCRVSGTSRMLIPTQLGISLIHGIAKIDKQLCGPVVRSQVEKYLDLIAQGKASHQAVVEHTLNIFVDKFNYFRLNIAKMDELFEASFSSVAQTAGIAKPLSKCGKCRRYMKLIQKIPFRLFCATCNETYNLPGNGAIRQYQDRTCPLDGFELVKWSSGTGVTAKSYSLCPMCYNHPPFGGDKMSCNKCTVPTCEYSVVKLGVLPCGEEGCDGTVVLDTMSQPKWRMNCNVCNYCVFLPEDAKKISLVPDEKCVECGTTIMIVDFNKNHLPPELKGTTVHKGCPLCDQVINRYCNEGHTKVTWGRRKFHKGKGKGKGGAKNKRNDPKLSFDRF